MNVNYLYDSDNVPLLADLMRTYRSVNLSSSAYNANDATLDTNGWATSDAWYFLGDPAAIKHGDGTYALKFTGIATVSMGSNNSGGTVLNQTYDPVTNTTTALLQTKVGVDLTEPALLQHPTHRHQRHQHRRDQHSGDAPHHRGRQHAVLVRHHFH
ncbi:MAG: hypothetical protein QM754_09985 [Tepidisphaeraceae bacterium]